MFTLTFDTSGTDSLDHKYNGNHFAEVLNTVRTMMYGSQFEDGHTEFVRDSNGNTIGTLTYERDQSPDTLYWTESGFKTWDEMTEEEQYDNTFDR